MSTQLLSSLGKQGIDLGLLKLQVDIEDTSYLSKYFVVSEFNPVFTAGKNVIAFNGSALLANDSEIQVQCIDSNGNSLYLEYPKSKTQFTDVSKFIVSIHVYNETYNGQGKLILVGKTVKKEIVRWITNIAIDKTLQNVSKVRFYNTPTLEVRPILYPIIANEITSELFSDIIFTGSFYSYAVTPKKDVIQSYVNPKKTDIDYRLVYIPKDVKFIQPSPDPTASFNSQLTNIDISLKSVVVKEPYTYFEIPSTLTSSFKIKNVIDSKTIQLSDAFYYPVGKDQVVTDITSGQFTASYNWIKYSTEREKYKKFQPDSSTTIYLRDSYAEIFYNNIKTFSGYVARHKVYRKSLIYLGDYELIADEPLGIKELLIDPISINKSYSSLGYFYNEYHISKYWFTSSQELKFIHSVSPNIDALKIDKTSTSYDNIDGTHYVIVKNDSIDTVENSYNYIDFNEDEYNNLQGASYNSNFINLKSGSLYVLSLNLMVDKDKNTRDANIGFYFTSSISTIKSEKSYIGTYGLKLGEVNVSESICTKIFSNKQYFYFTPLNDYYGTLVIVPYRCSPTISELSLGVYGDYGFSPDSLVTNIPFKINVANEKFEIKSELFDINSNVVYSNLKTVQTFDPDGWSTFTNIDTSNSNMADVTLVPTNTLGTVTTKDYVKITTQYTPGGVIESGKSLLVGYTGTGIGRKIVILKDGTKTIYQ